MAKRIKTTFFKNSESFRFNEETNEYIIINNETGKRTRVLSSGQIIPKYDLEISGMIGNKGRKKTEKEKPEFMFNKCESLKYDTKKGFYSKPPEKFIGYSQSPSNTKLQALGSSHWRTIPPKQSPNSTA
jgi:hypothetical protein